MNGLNSDLHLAMCSRAHTPPHSAVPKWTNTLPEFQVSLCMQKVLSWLGIFLSYWMYSFIFPLLFLSDNFTLGICPQHSKRFLRSLTKERLLEAKHSGPRLCIDLSMTNHMSKKVGHPLNSEFLLTWGRSMTSSSFYNSIVNQQKCLVFYALSHSVPRWLLFWIRKRIDNF